MSAAGTIVTRLVVDATDSERGVAVYESAMDRAQQALNDTSGAANSFDSALKKWTSSLANADPVLRAQINQQKALERQMVVNTDAVKLGIATQSQAEAQLEKVRLKYQGYIEKAEEAATAQTAFGKATTFMVGQLSPLIGLLSVGTVVAFGKGVFDTAAALNEQAEQAGVSTAALQAYRAQLLGNGISADQTDQILTRLTRSIGDARASAGPARDAFNQMGISLGTLKGGAEETLPAVAAALLKIQDPTQRASLEIDLLGKSGQRLESALNDLIDPTATLIQKQTALKQIMGTDLAEAADKADDRMAQVWKHLQDDAAPSIVKTTSLLADLLSHLADTAERLDKTRSSFGWGDLARGLTGGGFAATGTPSDPLVPNSPLGRPNATYAASIFPQQAANDSYDPVALDNFIAKQRLSASIAGQSPAIQAQTNALIEAANVKLNAGAGLSADQLEHYKNQDGSMRKFVVSVQEANDVLGASTSKEVQGLAATIQRGAAMDKLRQTYASYLSSLGEEARIAGLSAAQREDELTVIKAAQVLQKEQNPDAKMLVQTYAEAAEKLGDQRLEQVEIEAAAKRVNALSEQQAQQLQVVTAGLGVVRDQRELIVKNLQDELAAGVATGDEYARQRAEIEAKNAEIQHTVDLVGLSDYMADLREEASLAGMTADERERQEAVLRAMHAMHGALTVDQANEISGLVGIRQEMERWQQLTNDISRDFEGFFEDVLEHGNLNFGKLFRSIEASFAQMLAQMAAQAIAEPIIVPIVQSFAGTIGAGGALGSSGSASGFSALSSMFSGAGGMSGLDSIGSMLGFGTSTPGLAATTMSLPGLMPGLGAQTVSLGGNAALTTSGSLFGSATLGQTLGPLAINAAYGSLMGSLLFGNKNDASMGGSLGAVVGGPIGGLIGGYLGSIDGSSNHGAWVDLTNGGTNYAVTQQGSAANTAGVKGIADSITNAVTQLQDAGIAVTNNIKSIMVGGNKNVLELMNGQKQNLKAGDNDALLNAAMTSLLSTASSTDADVQKIIQNYQGQGGINSQNLSQFLSDVGFAGNLKATDFNPEPLTQAEQLLKQINDQFQTSIDRAAQLGLDTGTLIAARDHAVQEVIDGFNDAAAASLKQLTNPIQAAYDTLVDSQSDRLKEATALGADLAQVNQLSQAELEQFLLGLTEAQRQAVAAANNLTDSVAYQLAEGVGSLSDNINDLVDQANDAANAAKDAANNWAQAADALDKTSKALLISDQSLSPGDAYRNAESQFDQLKNAALGGDAGAASDLANFASQFLQTSYAFNASSTAYASDLAMVQQTLAQVASFSSTQQSLAQQQADAATAAIPLLQNISDTLKSQMVASKQQMDDLKAQVADLAKQIKLQNSTALMNAA